MAKTRIQTGVLTMKKEEEDRKPTLLLNGVSSTTRKITKRKPSQNRNKRLPAQQIKVEEDTDTKSLLQSLPKLPKRQRISQEQVNRLIDYVVNDKMTIREAALTVKIDYKTALCYYNLYKNDSEKKIPSPRNQLMHPQRVYSQQDIENLIAYIEDDKMTMSKASSKVNMTFNSGYHYYNKYLQDPNHNIPIPQFQQCYTQDQKDEFIGYVVNDKMNIRAASKKAKMNENAGRKYYHKYFNEQNPDIATPSHITNPSRYTQEEINVLISYIVDDKMTVAAASRKANFSVASGWRYSRQYLRDNNMEIPVLRTGKRYTQDEINKLIGYIADDKMTIKAATQKANMNYMTGHKYYKQYLKDHNLDLPTRSYAQDKINQLISYIVDDKISIIAASKKASMSVATGWKYYQRYLKEHNLGPLTQRYTQDKTRELIGYIVDDKMSITAASKKANMKYYTACRCYRRYLMDPKHDAPT